MSDACVYSKLLVNAACPLLRCPYREVCSHAFRGCSNVEVCSHAFSLLATFSIEMSGRVYNSSIGLQAIMKGPIWMYYSPTSSNDVKLDFIIDLGLFRLFGVQRLEVL